MQTEIPYFHPIQCNHSSYKWRCSFSPKKRSADSHCSQLQKTVTLFLNSVMVPIAYCITSNKNNSDTKFYKMLKRRRSQYMGRIPSKGKAGCSILYHLFQKSHNAWYTFSILQVTYTTFECLPWICLSSKIPFLDFLVCLL